MLTDILPACGPSITLRKNTHMNMCPKTLRYPSLICFGSFSKKKKKCGYLFQIWYLHLFYNCIKTIILYYLQNGGGLFVRYSAFKFLKRHHFENNRNWFLVQ